MSKVFNPDDNIQLDIDSPKDKERKLSQEDHLDSILYQFVTLYERWSEDRQVAAKQGADLAKVVKQFVHQGEVFTKQLEQPIRELHQRLGELENIECRLVDGLQERLTKTSFNFSCQVKDRIRDMINTEVRPLIADVRGAALDVKESLKPYKAKTFFSDFFVDWKMSSCIILFLVMVSLLSGTITAKWLMPRVPITLSEKDVVYLNAGRSLLNVWQKLSPTEKDKLQTLMNSESFNGNYDRKA